MNKSVIFHYDTLIDHNNDPFRDPEPLRRYMDKWDGDAFIEKLSLDKDKAVLEIGVGTGRLAHRTAPLCQKLFGIDISPKTIERAKINLSEHKNINLILGDFMTYDFAEKFDVVYSTLTFMHIKDKKAAINKVAMLLKSDGIFVLSIDKSNETIINAGFNSIEVFPDNPTETASYIEASGLSVKEQLETELAYIFVAKKA